MVNCSSLVKAVVNVARDPLILPPPRRGRVGVGVVHEAIEVWGSPPSLTLRPHGGTGIPCSVRSFERPLAPSKAREVLSHD